MAQITLVEDNPAIAKLVQLKLEQGGHEVRVYHDGKSGLEALLETPPDLALLDLNLPHMTGIEIARCIRESTFNHMPILMLTSQQDLQSRLQGLEVADDYVAKPFEPKELLARVSALLRRSSFVRIARVRNVRQLEGETIGSYLIQDRLGEGGMSVVYKAEDKQLQRPVALKFFTDMAQDNLMKQRFIREAQTASHLNHSNICNVHTIDETEDGHPFMVMPYLQGETLEDVIAKQPQGLAVAQVINYSRQIARGLAYAHDLGIVHRDIKPANIFVTSQRTLKILDFGVAKWAARSDGTTTQAGSMIGTVNYMAPEQILGKEVDHRVDCWALGVVMFEMLTGQQPFGAKANLISTIHAIAHESAPLVSEYRRDLTAGIESIVAKALEKDPEDRHDSMFDLLHVLDGVVTEHPFKPHSSS